MLELIRLSASERRAQAVAERLSAFEPIDMPGGLWGDARQIQLSLADNGDHRRVPPADLLLAAAARRAAVTLVHYDRDYERIAAVTDLDHRWFVADGTLGD